MIFRRYGAPPSAAALLDAPITGPTLGPSMLLPRVAFTPNQLVASALTAGVKPSALFRTPAATPQVESVAPADTGNTRILFARQSFAPMEATRSMLSPAAPVVALTSSGGNAAQAGSVTSTKPSATQLVSSVSADAPSASADAPDAAAATPDVTEEPNRTDILSVAPSGGTQILPQSQASSSKSMLFLAAGLGIAAFFILRK